MKTFLAASAAALVIGATAAHAVPQDGLSVTNAFGDGIQFIFDTVPSDIDGNADGLRFTDGSGLEIIATGSGLVRQDHPANGGLGILGGSDNLELGETLTLTFNKMVNILNFTFNGTIASNGHTDPADGAISFNTDNGFGGFVPNADVVDGIGDPASVQNFCANVEVVVYCNVTSITFTPIDTGTTGAPLSAFKGYLESIAIEVAVVPIPASLSLLLAGLGGLGIASRRRRKS